MTENQIQNSDSDFLLLNHENESFINKNFLQYIGSKRKLISNIIKHIKGQEIVDLMAGTHALGFFLKDKKKVIANDVMRYSYLIGKAIVESSTLKLQPLNIERNDRFKFFEKNYAGTYFTSKQCQDLDAIKNSIEKLEDEYLKACYYSCVFNILDRIGTTAGHFDGYLKQNSAKAKIRRDKDVIRYFENEVRDFTNKINKYDSKVYNLDAVELLEEIDPANTIYIDPPYNHRQYNTLYHILEMFAKYSGPLKKCLYKYPEERYFSPYSYKSRAIPAFDYLIKKASRKSNHIIFSYSNNGIVPIKKLIMIFEKYFDEINKEEIRYYHRKQKTSKGNGIVTEYIFSLDN